MFSHRIMRAGRLWVGAGALGLAMAGLGGCQTDYAVDITNRTPQPVYAKIFRKGGSGGMLGASTRLGPGDRAFLGPVRNNKNAGAFLSIDTYSNPTRPLTADIVPGTAYVEVVQDGAGPDSPLRIVEKK